MRLRSDGSLRLSPSDLSAHLACPHLTTLSLEVAHEERERPHVDDTHLDLILRKGREHEAAYLERLEREGRSIVRIPTYDDESFDADIARGADGGSRARANAQTSSTSRTSRSDDGRWHGFADFLEKTPEGTYEPVDTKLARSAKPAHVLQLLFYAEVVERLQGAPVERVHVENGRGERESFRVAELHAYYRRVRERFLSSLERDDETYPWPCGHCGICDFRNVCRAQLEADDHLVLVAGMRRGWAEKLMADGVETLARLGSLPVTGNGAPHGLRPESFEKVRHQAELQLRGRETGTHLYELLDDEEERGFRLLPEPDAGDVWLDLEGHPFYETARGLEFLFGYCYRDETGEVRYEALWARDREGERAVFERFVDWVVGRRLRHPRLHVYHYAAYERTALTRLMGEHGTREREVDDFLRQEVLVDLYRIVRQSLRASTPSYSIKAIEALYGFERSAEVKGGDDAVVSFETWLETGDESLLREVERYNEEDCRSTLRAARVAALDPAGRSSRGASRPTSVRRARRRSCATRSAPRSATGCWPARRKASRGVCSGTSWSTTSARRDRSGGRGSAGRSSTRTSSSRTAPRSAGCGGTGSHRWSRARATRTAWPSAPRSTRSRARGSTP